MVLALLVAAAGQAMAQVAPEIVLRLGTLAPRASRWNEIFIKLGDQLKEISGGKVELKIFSGGEQGDEPTMIQKMRIKKLQAVAISGAGLSEIEPGVNALQVPMMYRSYEELDYVRERLAPELEKRIASKGFLVLAWGDTGWVHFFTKQPAATVEELRKLKMSVIAGDSRSIEIYTAQGFRPETLAATDVLSGLKTGLVEAFQAPPLFALGNQWFGGAPNMIDVKWTPLIGAVVISKDAWNQLSEDTRRRFSKAALDAGESLRGEIRQLGDKAVLTMKTFGLKVTPVDAAAQAGFQRVAEATYPSLRGSIIPADVFDQARKLRDEYRKSHPSAGNPSKP
jgi:TRAP-type C4-dicarboxylate transport system substrate-binding protein